MSNRWLILWVLFFARTMMAFQYQSVAALSPFIADSYAASLTDIGLLIGLYLGPGVVVAIPGGSLAARFGDRRVVGWSLVAMLAGGLMMIEGDSWLVLMAGRVLAGIGGVVVNIVMTKMLVDWFTGHKIGTAMGIFISSWPIGIALALLVLPWLASFGGLMAGWLGMSVLVAIALAMFLGIYRPAPGTEDASSAKGSREFPVAALSLAAIVWALYNTALAMVFGFGSLVLIQQGAAATSAASVIGIFTFMMGVGVPFGGALSDKIGRDPVIFFSIAASALALPLLLSVPSSWAVPAYALAGLAMGLCPGPIMTMPGPVLPAEARAFGMGVFFAVYYAAMMVGPALGGGVAELTGDAGNAFWLATAMLVASIASLMAFRRTTVPAAA